MGVLFTCILPGLDYERYKFHESNELNELNKTVIFHGENHKQSSLVSQCGDYHTDKMSLFDRRSIRQAVLSVNGIMAAL
jgi:hypothetical protein